jgi:hypothetical protein
MWKDGVSDAGTDQDRERYRVKVAFLCRYRFRKAAPPCWSPFHRAFPPLVLRCSSGRGLFRGLLSRCQLPAISSTCWNAWHPEQPGVSLWQTTAWRSRDGGFRTYVIPAYVARFDSGDLPFRLCALAAFGVCVWSLRRSNRSAKRFEDEIATKVDRNELNDDEAFDIVVKRRSVVASSRAWKSWLFFLLTVGIATPFMAPLPLNVYWRPWGEMVLLICAFAFFITVLNTAFWWAEWYARRETNAESQSNTKHTKRG